MASQYFTANKLLQLSPPSGTAPPRPASKRDPSPAGNRNPWLSDLFSVSGRTNLEERTPDACEKNDKQESSSLSPNLHEDYRSPSPSPVCFARVPIQALLCGCGLGVKERKQTKRWEERRMRMLCWFHPGRKQRTA